MDSSEPTILPFRGKWCSLNYKSVCSISYITCLNLHPNFLCKQIPCEPTPSGSRTTGPTESFRSGSNRRCSACGSRFRPRVDPAMIVLVTSGRRCLLGRDCVEDEVFFFLSLFFCLKQRMAEVMEVQDFLYTETIFLKAPLIQHLCWYRLGTCTPAFSYLKWSEARPVGLRGVFRPWRVSSSLAKPWRNVSDARCARSQAGRDVRKLIGVDRILDGFGWVCWEKLMCMGCDVRSGTCK